MADSEYTALGREENGTDSNNNSNAAYGAMQTIKEKVIENPVQDFQEVATEAFSIMSFWHDMKRRERTGSHQAVLVLGFVQALVALTYCIVAQVNHRKKIDTVWLHYVIIEVAIAAGAQLVYTVRGICLENSPVLLMAAVNGGMLSLRLGLSIRLSLLPSAFDEVFFAIYLLLFLLTIAFSVHAWGGEFSRFIYFRIGADPEIQRLYRRYELLMATCLLDLQLSSMAIATVMFFTDVVWWHYFIFAILFFLSVVQRSSLRRAVREEHNQGMLITVVVYIILPLLLLVALVNNGFVDVQITPSCQAVAYFTCTIFFTARLVMVGVAYWCTKSFGRGLKDALANQKTSREFFASQESQFRPMFLAAGERKKEVSSYRLGSSSPLYSQYGQGAKSQERAKEDSEDDNYS